MLTSGLTSVLYVAPVTGQPPAPSPVVLLIPLVVGLIGFALFALAAVRTWRRGHKLPFAIGFVMPLAWVAGALVPPPRPGE